MDDRVRAQIRVQGQVQGVGFRPFVFRLASELGLAGWVRNDGLGVEIALEGSRERVDTLLSRLRQAPPQRAEIDAIDLDLRQPPAGIEGFTIEHSADGPVGTSIAPDAGVCADCLAELFDPEDRRHRYAFINCIQCGPRYTLSARLPYDRPNTSMAAFRQCTRCQTEFDAPADRRFHAQPNACPDCGPRLGLFDAGWTAAPAGSDVLALAAARLRAGQVLAVKGLGGFHLVCDARQAPAVARLRLGKARQHKPFAVMVSGVEAARRHARVDAAEQALLESAERPVVLLRKQAQCDRVLEGVAPGLARIGLMLPHTPLQYLLFHELAGRPSGTAWLMAPDGPALVMTSANPGGEPLVIDEQEARAALQGLADAFVVHDRAILQRCDDSVLRSDRGSRTFIRRARGFVPRRIALPAAGPSVLACGAALKSTVCVTRGAEAFVSQHIGDLEHAGARTMLEDSVVHLCRILQVSPQLVAHDLHADFFSSRFAAGFAAAHQLPCVAVQHHHAHIAAVCAEHGQRDAVLGLALDGMGLGADGGLWGGELLLVDGANSTRLAHLGELALPGGDQAARAPWRMAASALHAIGRGDEIARRFAAQPAAAAVQRLLASGTACTPTSSCGRLFDAVAGLLGVCSAQTYEGHAAMQLEGLAERHGPVPPMALPQRDAAPDLQPLLMALADCSDAAFGAALFHATLAGALADWAAAAARRSGIRVVALGGGCFLNAVLLDGVRTRLQAQGLRVLSASRLPTNDGGISLGQAWVALQSQLEGA